MNSLTKLLVATTLVFSSMALAQSQFSPSAVSPEMLEKFQSLPRDQREALARQYGVDTDNLGGTTVRRGRLGKPGQELTPKREETESEVFRPLYLPEMPPNKTLGLKRFGLDLFNAEVSTFAPTDNALVPDSYRLGVGDELIVQLFGKENDQYELEIGRSGDINFPRLGAFSVGGLEFEDARELIRTRVERQFIGVNAVVTMGRLRAINIFIAGEARVPGAYSVSALTTVTQALFQAGGVTDIGALRNVEVRRRGALVERFDAYDLLLRGDTSRDVRLRSGDVVFVSPISSTIEVSGEVKRRAIYEVVEGETIADVLLMTGGLNNLAFASQAVLFRIDADLGLSKAITLDLRDSSSLDLEVMDGDRLEIPIRGDEVMSRVAVTGAVNRPGDHGWFEGLRVSDLLGNVRRDLKPDADLGYSLIVRQKNEIRDIVTLQFSLADAISQKGTTLDPLLSEYDEVIIFSKTSSASSEEIDQERSVDKVSESGRRQAISDISQRLELPNNGREDSHNYRRDKVSPEVSGDVGPSTSDQKQISDAYSAMEDKESSGQSANEDLVSFSRENLLGPIIDQLRTQARQNEPVQLVSISGAVRSEGIYPLSEGATLKDLISAAGGLTDSAFLSSAELRRLTVGADGRVDATYRNLDLRAAASTGSDSIIPLISRDHMTIREVPDWSPTDSVEIVGEVRFPGNYRIRQGETLAGVIKRAGGFTSEAFPEAAIFTRETIAILEKERASEFARNVQQTYASRLLTEETISQQGGIEDLDLILEALKSTDTMGRLLIDLPAAVSGDRGADIELEDGDVLHIPIKANTVSVIGEVLRPGTHTFKRSLNLKDYLDLSAGLSARADEGGIYVIKANGAVDLVNNSLWRFGDPSNVLDPGDTIVVPINTQYKETLASWNQITQIIYQSMVSIAAVANL